MSIYQALLLILISTNKALLWAAEIFDFIRQAWRYDSNVSILPAIDLATLLIKSDNAEQLFVFSSLWAQACLPYSITILAPPPPDNGLGTNPERTLGRWMDRGTDASSQREVNSKLAAKFNLLLYQLSCIAVSVSTQTSLTIQNNNLLIFSTFLSPPIE
jgi:hypothetical protein